MKKLVVALAVALIAVVVFAGTSRAAKPKVQTLTPGAVSVEGNNNGSLIVDLFNPSLKVTDVVVTMVFNSGFGGTNIRNLHVTGNWANTTFDCVASSCLGIVTVRGPKSIIPSASYTIETTGTVYQTGQLPPNVWKKI